MTLYVFIKADKTNRSLPLEVCSFKPQEGKMNNWLRALSIAKILMEMEGYHTAYLEELERYIRQQMEKEKERSSRGK